MNIRIIKSASSFINKSVKNPRDQELGVVKDIMLDISNGHIAYVVLSFGGFLGFGDKLFAVPWGVLKYQGSHFVLNLLPEVLEKLPGFDKDEWPDMNNPSWQEQVAKYYKEAL